MEQRLLTHLIETIGTYGKDGTLSSGGFKYLYAKDRNYKRFITKRFNNLENFCNNNTGGKIQYIRGDYGADKMKLVGFDYQRMQNMDMNAQTHYNVLPWGFYYPRMQIMDMNVQTHCNVFPWGTPGNQFRQEQYETNLFSQVVPKAAAAEAVEAKTEKTREELNKTSAAIRSDAMRQYWSSQTFHDKNQEARSQFQKRREDQQAKAQTESPRCAVVIDEDRADGMTTPDHTQYDYQVLDNDSAYAEAPANGGFHYPQMQDTDKCGPKLTEEDRLAEIFCLDYTVKNTFIDDHLDNSDTMDMTPARRHSISLPCQREQEADEQDARPMAAQRATSTSRSNSNQKTMGAKCQSARGSSGASSSKD